MRIAVQLLVFGFSSCTAFMCSSAEIEGKISKEHVIEITGFAFVPSEIRANPGDTITWVNRDIVPHTATSKNDSWGTGTLPQNESHTLIVSASMESDYLCRFHTSMTATISLHETGATLNSIENVTEKVEHPSADDKQE